MYEPAPDEAELAAFGMTLEDLDDGPVEIWPDNVVAFNLFSFLGTQWRTGADGPAGLDYGVMHHKMDRMKLSEQDFEQIERDVQIMEAAALNEIHRPKK